MNKRSLELLEKVFGAELEGALNNGIGLFQTRSKLAEQLEADGYLTKHTTTIGGRFPVNVTGYRLTLLGNLTYCTSDLCLDAEQPAGEGGK